MPDNIGHFKDMSSKRGDESRWGGRRLVGNRTLTAADATPQPPCPLRRHHFAELRKEVQTVFPSIRAAPWARPGGGLAGRPQELPADAGFALWGRPGNSLASHTPAREQNGGNWKGVAAGTGGGPLYKLLSCPSLHHQAAFQYLSVRLSSSISLSFNLFFYPCLYLLLPHFSLSLSPTNIPLNLCFSHPPPRRSLFSSLCFVLSPSPPPPISLLIFPAAFPAGVFRSPHGKGLESQLISCLLWASQCS